MTKQPSKSAIDPQFCEEFTDVSKKTVVENALGGGDLAEGTPQYNQLPCEDIYSGKNNTWIVLGRDRPAGSISGNINSTQSGMIDIVVGRMGGRVRECLTNGEKIWIDPIFSGDAARIYISQKTAIDKNFRLAPGKIGSPGGDKANSKVVSEVPAESGIAVKADQVRIIARRGIKLVTMGKQEATSHTDKVPRSIQGIDIIAGNTTEGKQANIQPLVKGNNLVAALTKLSKLVEELAGIAHQSLIFQDEVNGAAADHMHIWGDGKQLTTASHPLSTVCKNTVDAHAVTSMKDYEKLMKKITFFQTNYLLESADKYINSRWNNVN